MCLMAVAPRAHMIPRDNLQNAFDHNSHGWGIMYARGGRVITTKERAGMNRFYDAWGRVPDDVPVAVHFRFGTSGPENDAMCHPFQVLDKDRDGMDLYMMHNGVLGDFRGDTTRSDTLEMVQDVLTPMLQGKPGFVRSEAFKRICDVMIGHGNKLVFLEGGGRWHFINRDAGKQIKKVWYSNEYSLKKVFSGHGTGKRALHEDDMMGDWGTGSHTYYGQGSYFDKDGKYTPPEHAGGSARIIGKPAHSMLPPYMVRSNGRVVDTRPAPALITGTASTATDIHIPMLNGPGTAALSVSNMREGTLATMSEMGAVPKAPEVVDAAIKAGATLTDSEDTLRAQFGIGLRDLAQYIFDGAEYVIKHAKGSVSGVVTLRNKAFLILEAGRIEDAQARYETPLDKLAREARDGQPMLPSVMEQIKGPLLDAEDVATVQGEDREAEISDMFWQHDNLKNSSPTEIFEAVVDDPDGATDFILAALGLVCWEQ